MTAVWQVGLIVNDLEVAMRDLTLALGVTWVTPQQRCLDVVHESQVTSVELRFTMSVEGPIHLELIEGVPSSPWWPPQGLDHLAVWSANLVTSSERLAAGGFELEATYAHPSGALLGFTYHRGSSGLRVEHVDETRRPGLEAWLAGGEFPAVD